METTTNTNTNDLAIVIGRVRNRTTICDMLDKAMSHYRPDKITIYMRTALNGIESVGKWAKAKDASVAFIDSPDWIDYVDFEHTMMSWYTSLFAVASAERKVLIMDVDPCKWDAHSARIAAFAASEGFDLATVSDNGFAKIDDYTEIKKNEWL